MNGTLFFSILIFPISQLSFLLLDIVCFIQIVSDLLGQYSRSWFAFFSGAQRSRSPERKLISDAEIFNTEKVAF